MNVTSESLQEAILGTISEPAQNIIRRVSIAGQKVLFDKNTHSHVFGDIENNEGAGVAHLMLMLYDQSKQTMPRGAILPASAILLAKVFEFEEKAKTKPVNDMVFDQAMQEMSVVLADRFDPEFRNKVAEKTGKQVAQPQPQEQSPEQPQAQGLINARA
jgi:hypothetical protein